MAQMDEFSSAALGFLLGDRSVFATEEELSAAVRQYGEKLREITEAEA